MKTGTLIHTSLLSSLLFVAAAADELNVIEIDQAGTSGARPLVFIPGLASSADVWSQWAEEFGESHEIHIVGIKGFAGLPAVADLTFDRIVGDITRYLDSRDLSNAVIAGHSAGGMIAMQAAAQSERIGSLVLIDSVPFTAGLFIPGITPEAAIATAQSLGMSMRATPPESFREQQRAGLVR